MPSGLEGEGSISCYLSIYEFKFALLCRWKLDSASRTLNQVANILLARAGRGGGGGVVEAAAEIARAAARAWFAPILEAACERLAFVLKSLFDLSVERNRSHESDCKQILSSISFF